MMQTEAGLSAAFLGALPETARADLAQHPELGVRIVALLGEAKAALGQLTPDDMAFARHIAGAIGDDATLEALNRVRVADLYLAFACATGAPRALEAFEAEFGRDIDIALTRAANLNLSRAEFRQLVRDKLFVGTPDRRPKIGDYAGRGDLRSWVRVTVLRMIIDLIRHHSGDREQPCELAALSAIAAAGDDPELGCIQRNCDEEFRSALEQGFARLSVRDRNLLRHQLVQGLTIDQVGGIYGVHRTTAFRWIERARKALLLNTREALQEQLRVSGSELLSIMRVFQGDLEVSVRRLLRSQLEAEPVADGA